MTTRSVLSRKLLASDREIIITRSDLEGKFPQETGKYFLVAIIDEMERTEFASYDKVSHRGSEIALSVTHRGVQSQPLQFKIGNPVIFIGEDRPSEILDEDYVPEWGTIGGELNNQTDLKEALDKKIGDTYAHFRKSDGNPPPASEGEVIYYTTVHLEGSVKVTEHKLRDSQGNDTLIKSFREAL